jgi:hypothetical protein
MSRPRKRRGRPSKRQNQWNRVVEINPRAISLVTRDGKKARHLHCFKWDENEIEYIATCKKSGKIFSEYFPKELWIIGGRSKNPRFSRKVFEHDHPEPDVVTAPVPSAAPVVASEGIIPKAPVRVEPGDRSPGNLNVERPGEYNVWAHPITSIDPETAYKANAEVEANYARSEALRKFETWKARRAGLRGVGVGSSMGGVSVGTEPER